MQHDPFCGKEILDAVFLESEHFVAAYDRSPVLPGHSLVIPKRHVESILELSSDEMVDLGIMLNRLIPKLLKAYDADAYNISINTGALAGQSIAHLHIHVVPRRRDGPFQGKGGRRELFEAIINREAYAPKGGGGELERLREIFRYTAKEQER